MKKSKSILTLALAVSFSFLLLSCGDNTKPNKDGATSKHDHNEMTHETDNNMSEDSGMAMSESKSISNLIDDYLAIKNALVQDDSKAAGKAGQKLAENAAVFDVSSVDDSVQTEIIEILEVLKEHGEHIAKSEIDHQREHFEGMGVDFMDLVAISGTDRTLYQQYCPMYNEGEGGSWLSASDEIMNPLYGSKMLSCGSVTETISMK